MQGSPVSPSNSRTMTRREMLLLAGTAAAGLSLWPAPVFSASTKMKKVLFFSKSSGYEHSVIKRKGTELSFAEKILADIVQGRKLLPIFQ